MATLLLVIIYVCFLGLGLPDSLLGAAWPGIYPELGVPVSVEAVGSAVIILGTIISSLNAARLIKKFGTYRVTLVSTLLTAAAIFGYGLAPNFFCLLLLGIPMGLGAGAIDAALNNYLALHYKASHMNWLHCFWGIGAMLGPVILSAFMYKESGWRQGYFAIGAVQVIVLLVLAASAKVWEKQNKGHEEKETTVIKLPDLMKIKGVKLSMLIFLCYCATEYTVVCWGSTYLVQSRGVSDAAAAGWISAYYLGISLGRILSGFLALKVENKKLISGGLCILMAGAVTLMLPFPSVGALVGLGLIGFGCAPVFPGMISETPGHFGKKLSQAVISVEMASAYTGALIMPVLFGFLAAGISMSLIPFFIAFLAAILFVLTALLRRVKSLEA
jgi:fucose permease